MSTDNGEVHPLLNKSIDNDKTGPATSNPKDRPYSPAPNNRNGSINESSHYEQIRGTQLPNKDYDVSVRGWAGLRTPCVKYVCV